VIVRRELPEDRGVVSAVHTAAFGGGRAAEDVPEARLVDLLRTAGDTVPELSFVALRAGDVVGHVTCSRARVGDAASLGLGPLGVLPAAQRTGVGSALMHAVLGAADALSAPVVVLLGDPAYYGRFGFGPADELGIRSPDPAWGRYFQARPLSAWQGRPTGDFRYASAFSQLP
jgi:putative acetyltransferase